MQGGSRAGGAVGQAAPDGTPDQDFAFEDAGDGLVYIRSNLTHLYVTVDAAREPVLENPTTAGGPAAGPVAGPTAGPVGGPTPAGVGPAHLQVHVPDHVKVGPVVFNGGTPVAPAGPGRIQETKYRSLGPRGAVEVGQLNPAYQRWRLTPASLTAFERDLFVISSEAFPGQVLQVADPAQAGSAVVLGDSGGHVVGVFGNKHIWTVSTRLISDVPVATTR